MSPYSAVEYGQITPAHYSQPPHLLFDILNNEWFGTFPPSVGFERNNEYL